MKAMKPYLRNGNVRCPPEHGLKCANTATDDNYLMLTEHTMLLGGK